MKDVAAASSAKNQTSKITGLAVEKAKLPPMAKWVIVLVAVMFPLASYGFYRWKKKKIAVK